MWSLVAFSIPEEHRAARDELRKALRWLGFAPLYDGLWVSPRDHADGVLARLRDLGISTATAFRATALPAIAVARNAVAVLMPRSRSRASTPSAWSRGDTHRPSCSGAKPSQRNALRSSSRAALCSSGMENATSDHIPSHCAPPAPKEKMRRAPSSSTSAARSGTE